jgi:hypothetical protein
VRPDPLGLSSEPFTPADYFITDLLFILYTEADKENI